MLALAGVLLCSLCSPLARAAGAAAAAQAGEASISSKKVSKKPASRPHQAARKAQKAAAEPVSELGRAEVIDDAMVGMQGHASFYAPHFTGRKTSTGEVFDPRQFSAASNRYPPGTQLAVRRLDNDRCAIVRVNDRMAGGHGRRIIDVSRSVAEYLGMIQAGVVLVRVVPIKSAAGQRDAVACRAAFDQEERVPDSGRPPRLPEFGEKRGDTP